MATSSRSLTSRPSQPRPACTPAGRRGGPAARAGPGGRAVTTPAWPRSPSWSTTRPRSAPCQPRLTRVSHYPQFAAVTADIGGYVDQVLAETNLGYINSGVALRVQRFCLELATINDTQLSLSFLNKFQAMKVGPVLTPRVTCHVSPRQGSVVTLRNSADAAHLFADKFAACGVSYIHSVRAKLTLSISRKSCALGGSLQCACAVTDPLSRILHLRARAGAQPGRAPRPRHQHQHRLQLRPRPPHRGRLPHHPRLQRRQPQVSGGAGPGVQVSSVPPQDACEPLLQPGGRLPLQHCQHRPRRWPGLPDQC